MDTQAQNQMQDLPQLQTSQQPQIPSEPNKTNPLLLSLLIFLITIIIVLTTGLFFLDEIKLQISKYTQGTTENLAATPSVEVVSESSEEDFSNIVCRRFTDIEEAIKYYTIACSLDLSNQNLTTLSSDITKLNNLTSIDLSGNNLSEFPELLTNIENLKEINLSDNNISSIPPSISRLINLQSLNLTNNNLTSLPNEIGKLELYYLTLSGNNINQAEINSMFPPREDMPNIEIAF